MKETAPPQFVFRDGVDVAFLGFGYCLACQGQKILFYPRGCHPMRDQASALSECAVCGFNAMYISSPIVMAN